MIADLDELPRGIHAEGGFVSAELRRKYKEANYSMGDDHTYLDCYEALVEADCHFIRVLAEGDTPRLLERVAQRIFHAECTAVPQLHLAILTATDNDREVRVPHHWSRGIKF
jgi:hypothetical protein